MLSQVLKGQKTVGFKYMYLQIQVKVQAAKFKEQVYIPAFCISEFLNPCARCHPSTTMDHATGLVCCTWSSFRGKEMQASPQRGAMGGHTL